MKTITGILIIFATLSAGAQNQIARTSSTPSISKDLEKVARDYYDAFAHLKGEKISETENIIEYASNINPKDAIESSIMQIKTLDNTYSWQTLLVNTENFKEAAAKYKQLYQQIVNGKITMNNGKLYKLRGTYDAPDEGRSFASTILSLDTIEQKWKQFKIELTLNYLMPDWAVKIYVYEKEEDEDIRPTVNSDY